jgi:hypothetical protein
MLRATSDCGWMRPVWGSPDSKTDIVAQPLPPGGRVKTATLPRQGDSSIKLTAFGRSFCWRFQN